MNRCAWILFWIGVLLPAPGCLYHGVWGLFSGLSVVGRVFEWSRSVPYPLDGRHFLAILVLTLSLFSNVFWAVWAIRMNLNVEISRAFRILLVGSLANNLLVPLFFPEFLRLPGFWFWLLAWVALCWTHLMIPGTIREEDNPRAAAVPTLIWLWLGFLVFWMGVTEVNRLAPSSAVSATKTEPAALPGYFNDPGHLLPPDVGYRFDGLLSAFEKETSSQIAVAVYPHLPAVSVEEFTLRTAERSRLGRKGLDNGAILFVFMADRVARLEVGYGLEGALPDITAMHILDQDLAPRFARGEYTGGLDASLAAILAAVRADPQKADALGVAAVVSRQLTAATKRFRIVWAFLRVTNAAGRAWFSFLGGLLVIVVWSGLANGARLACAVVRGGWNLVRHRPFGTEIRQVNFSSLWDSLKIAAFFAVFFVAIEVLVAYGGAFGGAGALIRW